MKKRLLLVLAFIMSINAFGINTGKTSFFDNIKLPYECNFYSEHGWIVCFVYSSNTDCNVYWAGSGFIQVFSDLKETDNEINIEFLKMWCGVEETRPGDKRGIYKYSITMDKKHIINGLKRVDNVTPVFFAEDSYDSVNKFDWRDPFYVNKETSVKETADADSKTIGQIGKDCSFELKNIICTKKFKDDIWLKINYNEKEGYIPFSCFSANWTIKENNLDKQFKNGKKNALCNDTRVRIRKEPNLDCETLGYLNIDDKVKIIQRSDKEFTIDGEKWYWYQVESQDKPYGWVYGKYLNIE